MPTIETRQSRTGQLTHRVKVRLKGQPVASATFNRLTDARRWAQITEAAMLEGRYFKTTEAKRHTVGDLIDRYLREVGQTCPRSLSSTQQRLLWWKAELGRMSLDQLTPPLIAEKRNELLAQRTRRGRPRSPATVVRYMASLSHALNVAVKEWQWLDDSPMRKVSKPREPRGRDRFLTEEERKRLLDACRQSSSQFLYPVVVLALSTGMRRGELMNLRWSDVDLHRGHILLKETKNGTSRGVPLVGYAREQIEKLGRVRRIDTDLLFFGTDPQRPVDLTKPWRTAVAKSMLKDFRFHDLRHTAASYLAMTGASTIEIAAVLGHKTLAMVKRYSHLSTSHAATVVAAMNAKMFGGHQ